MYAVLFFMIYFIGRYLIQLRFTGSPVTDSSSWKRFLAVMSLCLAGSNIGIVIGLADKFHRLEASARHDCLVLYHAVNCTSAFDSWSYSCLWLVIPSFIGCAILFANMCRVRRRLGDSFVVFHPRPLAYSLALFMVTTVACTLLSTPLVFFKTDTMSFRTWKCLYLSLAMIAINAFIFGVVVFVDAAILLVLQLRREWLDSRQVVAPNVGQQQGRGRHRRSQPEWIPLESWN